MATCLRVAASAKAGNAALIISSWKVGHLFSTAPYDPPKSIGYKAEGNVGN